MHLVSTTEPNATFPPSHSTSSLILFLSLLFQSTTTPTPYSSVKKKKSLESTLLPPLIAPNALHSSHSISSSSFPFFFLSLSSSVFQSVHFPRVVPFAPITHRRMIPYPKGERNGKILSSPVTWECVRGGTCITECTTGLSGRE